jgi:hypothetical protein
MLQWSTPRNASRLSTVPASWAHRPCRFPVSRASRSHPLEAPLIRAVMVMLPGGARPTSTQQPCADVSSPLGTIGAPSQCAPAPPRGCSSARTAQAHHRPRRITAPGASSPQAMLSPHPARQPGRPAAPAIPTARIGAAPASAARRPHCSRLLGRHSLGRCRLAGIRGRGGF